MHGGRLKRLEDYQFQRARHAARENENEVAALPRHPERRPRSQLHDAIEADAFTWNTVREWVVTVESTGSQPEISIEALASYRHAMDGIREFDVWDGVSMDRLDARDELVALITGERPLPRPRRAARSYWNVLCNRAFTIRPAWESPYTSDPQLTKELMLRDWPHPVA